MKVGLVLFCSGEMGRQTAYKPGSVQRRPFLRLDGHSSGTPVAERLAQPTRTTTREHVCQRLSPWPAVPIWSCSERGLPCHLRCRRRGALLPHPFTLTRRPLAEAGGGPGGLLSVALSLGSRPPGVTRRPVPVEPGLSSLRAAREERPSGRLASQRYGRRDKASSRRLMPLSRMPRRSPSERLPFPSPVRR